MGSIFNRVKTWATKEKLLSADLNAEFDNILDNLVPDQVDDFSSNASQMQQTVDPGEVGTESLATTTAGELERLRFTIAEIKGSDSAEWYSSSLTDISEIRAALGSALDSNRLVSGRVRADSSQPTYLEAEGSAATLNIRAVATDLVYFVNGTRVTVTADATITSLVTAPAANNTALVNDVTIADSSGTKLLGEYNTTIPIDTIGSEISSLNGEIAAFKVNNGVNDDFFIARVGTSELTDARRGFFFDSSSTPLNRFAIANNDTITLLKLTFIFGKNDGTFAVTFINPIVSKATPSSPAVGQYWFDLVNNTWKIFNSVSFVSADATFIGWCAQDATNTVAARSQNFDVNPIETNTVKVENTGVTSVAATEPGQKVAIRNNLIDYDLDKVSWDISTDLESGFSEAADTIYYLYVDEQGGPKMSPTAPFDRRDDFLGFYHPHHVWRAVGEVLNDGSSNLTSVFSYSDASDKDYTVVSSVTTNALTLLLHSSLAAEYEFRDSVETTGESELKHILETKSITVPSGATLGHDDTENSVYLYMINSGSIMEPGVSAAREKESEFQTTILLDTSSDVKVLFSDTVRTDKVIRLYSRHLSTQASAGTWALDMTMDAVSRELVIATGDPDAFLAATSSVETPTASGVWQSLTGNSIILQPGKWKLMGTAIFQGSAAPAYTGGTAGWFSANGDDTATTPSRTFANMTIQAGGGTEAQVLSVAQNEFATSMLMTAGTNVHTMNLPTLRVDVTAAQTVFVVTNAIVTTPGNARIWVQVYAERIDT